MAQPQSTEMRTELMPEQDEQQTRYEIVFTASGTVGQGTATPEQEEKNL